MPYRTPLLNMFLIPLALYLVPFTIVTWPLMAQFSTHLFADQGDGLQNYWNLWWMNRSVVEMHQPFWKTPYLHYPYGTSLLGHTLNPFNGLLAIPLLRFLTLLEAHNVIVVFSFAVGGLTAFWLSHHFTRAYWPSVVGGGVFTFSNFHFAHAQGHLQLVSLEWIPLFALLWYRLLERPRPLLGVGAALALFAVALCDYYYLFYSVLLGALMVMHRLGQGFTTRTPGHEDTKTREGRTADLPLVPREQRGQQATRARTPGVLVSWCLGGLEARAYLLSLGAFLLVALPTSGVMVLAVLLLNASDPLIGAHPTKEYSLDLLAPFIPGGHWRFAELTAGYWGSLPAVIHESSVHIGLSVAALLVYVWRRGGLGLWYAALTLFFLLSLGPVPHLWGREVSLIPSWAMPYSWLGWAFPPLALSGVPVRMMVMVVLAASVIAAVGFKMLMAVPGRQGVALLLLALLVVEYLPAPMPASRLSAPAYVEVLKGQKDDKGVLDTTAGMTQLLYHQTIHQKPIAFGYIARLPSSVAHIDAQLSEVLKMRDYAKLRREFGIRYLVVDAATPVPGAVLYEDERVRLYDLGSE